MHSLPPRLMERAWDCGSAAPLLNRMGAACGLSTTLRVAQDFVSHYVLKPRHTSQLCLEIALDLKTAFTPTTRSFESMNAGRLTQREECVRAAGSTVYLHRNKNSIGCTGRSFTLISSCKRALASALALRAPSESRRTAYSSGMRHVLSVSNCRSCGNGAPSNTRKTKWPSRVSALRGHP